MATARVLLLAAVLALVGTSAQARQLTVQMMNNGTAPATPPPPRPGVPRPPAPRVGAAGAGGAGGAAAGIDGAIDKIIAGMSTAEKIAQIAQYEGQQVIDYGALERGEYMLDATKLTEMANLGIGSYLNTPTSGGPKGAMVSPTAAQWRGAMAQLQDAYLKLGKIPPVFGIDSMHGANYVNGSIMYPHALHTAASFSTKHAYNAARSAARHTRSAGPQWVFGPVLDLPMHSRFPRAYESPGEDPNVVKAFGIAQVQGLQGLEFNTGMAQRLDNSTSYARPIPENLAADDVVAATVKHYLGYMAARSGYDRAPSWMPHTLIRGMHLPPYAESIAAGSATVMTSYNSPDDMNVVVNSKWMRSVLRGELKFKGMVVTDWTDIYNLVDWFHSAEDGTQAIAETYRRSSVDMAMVPWKADWPQDAMQAVNQKMLTVERLDIAVKRVLQLKRRLGLLPNALLTKMGVLSGAPPQDVVAKPIAQLVDVAPAVKAREMEESLQAAKDGIVLVKNSGVLPLTVAPSDTIAVVGPNAKSAGSLLGGWSIHWQGAETTDFDSLAQGFAKESNASVVSGTCVTAHPIPKIVNDNCLEQAKAATKAIIFHYGESHYAEQFGNQASGWLPNEQLGLARLVKDAAKAKNIPVIGVYTGGRDRLLRKFDALFDAHLVTFYPGPYGAKAISSVILGSHNPSGRLPVTMHADDAQNLPYWRLHSEYTHAPITLADSERTLDKPLYPFGHGLSYTTFSFSALQVAVGGAPASGMAMFGATDTVTATVTVTNSGARAGGCPVILKVEDLACIVAPTPAMVKGFTRVELAAGASEVVKFKLDIDDFAFEASDTAVPGGGRFVQPGKFSITVGNLAQQVQFKGNPLETSEFHMLRKGEVNSPPLSMDLY